MKIAAPRSLLGQFIALHIVIAIIAACALPFGVAILLHRTTNHYQHNLLRQQAAIVARALTPGHNTTMDPRSNLLLDGMSFILIDAARKVNAAQGPSRPAIVARAPFGPRPHFFRQGAIAAFSVPFGDRWIIVSQDSAAPEVVTDNIVQTFLNRFAVLLIPIVALVPLAGALLSLRLTRRMKAVSAIAAGIGPRTLDVRLPRGTLPLEVEPLAASTNGALDRLERGFRAQAAFAADIAHELRTPLAVIRLRADAVAEEDIRKALLLSVDRAARIVTQMLTLADLEQPIEQGGEMLDLRALAEAIIADRAPGIMAGGRTIALDVADGAVVFGFAGLIILAVENLIDNATRHTPAGTTIVVGVGPGPRLSVSDDGPGLSDDEIARVRRRFWRAQGVQAEGMGVGLSIVERVAEAHGGSLAIRAEAGGYGLRFTLDFSGSVADA